MFIVDPCLFFYNWLGNYEIPLYPLEMEIGFKDPELGWML